MVDISAVIQVRFTGTDKTKASNGDFDGGLIANSISGSANPRLITETTQYLDMDINIQLSSDSISLDADTIDITAFIRDRITGEYVYVDNYKYEK